MNSTFRLVSWILDGVVFVLCVLGIVCYFFGAFWTVSVSYNLSAEQLQEGLTSAGFDGDFEFDGEEEIPISVGIRVGTDQLFASFSDDATAMVASIVDSNVDYVLEELSETIKQITGPVVRSVAKKVVTQEVHNQVREILARKNEGITDDEVRARMEASGVTDEFLNQKTDEIFDVINSGTASKEDVADQVVDSVKDVYRKLEEGGDQDFAGETLSAEQEESIRNAVNDSLDELTQPDGTINLDEFIADLLLSAVDSMGGGGAAADVRLTAADDGATASEGSATDRLRASIREMIETLLPPEINEALLWVFRSLAILMFVSMGAWLYVIIKLIVKLAKFSDNPTVKLKVPIWLGWIPYLFLAGVPSLMLWILGLTGVTESVEALSALSISFSSIGWVAALCAGLCFAISIVFIVFRKKFLNDNSSKNASVDVDKAA